jgi:putative transposase
VARRCREAQLRAPNTNTVRVRIAAIPARERLGRRSHRKAAVDQFAPRPGVFDSAQRPLDLVQIDHTKLDIIVVDDEQRLPIGRPWITLAIDVYSRMVASFYISLDPPGAIATGLCIAHATLPKEAWLAKLGVGSQWPCWGLAARIHLDNAKEFHGEMVRRACEQYGIVLEYRPVAQPHMGGHIERMLGTLLGALHELPGATFSSPQQRGPGLRAVSPIEDGGKFAIRGRAAVVDSGRQDAHCRRDSACAGGADAQAAALSERHQVFGQ